MTCIFYALQFSTLFFFELLIIIPFTNGYNANYTVCSTTQFNCGNIQNVTYPFWGGDRPEFCGHPGLGLTCQNGTTFIYRMGTAVSTDGSENGSVSARVVSIDASSHTMSLVQIPFAYDSIFCENLIKNETVINLSARFKFTPLVTNISLFFSCNTSSTFHRTNINSFACNNSINDTGFAYYFDRPADVDKLGKSCNTRMVVPVLKSELNELSKGRANLREVLDKGFEVEYKVDFNGCLACQNSGGLCGSTYNNGSSENISPSFVCYCRDGGHPQVCPNTPKRGKKSLKYIGLAIGFGGSIVIVAVIAILYWMHQKFCKAHIVSDDCSESQLGKDSQYFGVPLFSYKELEEATGNFDQTRELGGGGYGIVYFGKLKDGREVAVKRLYERSFKRVEQFMNEVQILTCLRHQNLVSLYGCTSCHSRELLLVYEYVSNGTVADHLYGHDTNSGSLSWENRLKIAIETATAISYLHASDIIHRDVKTNNILVDKNFNVKVADFGLSRLFPNDVTHVSTAPQGTPGYLDPEYHQCYQLTDKSDVYSFGIVLIELISSLRAVDMNRNSYEINLSNYAMNKIKRCAFSELVDPKLGFKSDFKVKRMTTSVAELAFQCLQHYKDFRPSMEEVLEVLLRIQSVDYEALQAEEMRKNDLVQNSNLSPSPTDDDDEAKLLSDHQMCRHSPTSVMEIVSSSTISESTNH